MFFLIVVPSIGLIYFIKIGFGTNNNENIMMFMLCLPILIMIIAPLMWLTNLLSIRVNIFEDRLEFQSIFKRFIVKWNEIAEFNKKSYFSGTFPIYGPPRDLEIKTTNNKTVKIYYFIESDTGDDGIKNIELDIKKYLTGNPTASGFQP
jgi:hypothetical protein